MKTTIRPSRACARRRGASKSWPSTNRVFAAISKGLESARALLEDLAFSLRDFADRLEFSPERLAEIEVAACGVVAPQAQVRRLD